MKYDVYQGLFIWPLKKPLNLHLTYFIETLYLLHSNKQKAPIRLESELFPILLS